MIKETETIYRFVKDINPLSPKSDKRRFSLNNINTQSRNKVVRINEKNHKRENALIFYQILSTNSLRKCIETSLENFYVNIGA